MSPRNVVRLAVLLPSMAGFLAAAEPPLEESTYQPPRLRFTQPMGLVDAVRLTLAHDPLIRLQQTDMAFKAGLLQEARGEFDTTVSGELSLEYRRDELPDSTKKKEQDKRDTLDQLIEENAGLQDDLTRAQTYLNDSAFRNNPKGYDVTAGIDDESLQTDMETIQAELVLIDDLIARATDPNVRQDLRNLRDQVLFKSLDRISQGLGELASALPKLRDTRAALGDTPEDQWRRTGRAQLSASRKLRSGILVSPYTSWDYSASNYVGKTSTDAERGGMGVKPLHTLEVGFNVLVPLRRGQGRASATTAERAADADLEATRLAYLQQKSRSVLDATQAYWELRASQEDLDVVRRQVKLQDNLLTMTRALVKAKQLPRVEETRALASLADAQSLVEAGERRLRQAQVSLARIMGVALEDLATAPTASEAFPTPPEALSTESAALTRLVKLALERRYDRRAAQRTRDAAGILAQGAKLDTRRLVNLDVRLWGSSVNEESPAVDSWVFRSGRAALELQAPLRNDQLRGRLAQRRATLGRAGIDVQDLERRIALAVLQNSATLRATAQQVKLADQAVRQYDRTVEDEQAKFKLGESTLIDVIVTTQQATSARQALVSAARDYASLLAQLRYEAGLLVEEKEGRSSVSAASLEEVPEPLRAAAPAGEVSR